MKAEIISIGTELLLGHIVNTNTSYISKKMAGLGIDVYYHSTVGDNEERLSGLVQKGLSRSDIIFTTGGLGPTVDDITIKTVSKAIGKELVFDKHVAEEIKKYFKRQHLPTPKDSLKQAFIPGGCVWCENTVGTAPGLIIPHKEKTIICLPGPPGELQPLMEKYIMPHLKKTLTKKEIIHSKSIRLIGLLEAAINARVKDLLALGGSTTVGIYVHLGEVELKITAKAKSQKACNANIEKIELKIRKRLGKFIYGSGDETLESAVGKLLLKFKKTLGIAESCTGGLISSRVTNVSGSSEYFKMGLIAYSDDIKISELGVSPELLRTAGAVSSAAAVSMAKGIKRIAGTHIGLAVTGIAGPKGGTNKKPVGLVYMALVTSKKLLSKKFFFRGNRTDIKYLASQAALNLIRKYLLKIN